jgi:hypothetical protein
MYRRAKSPALLYENAPSQPGGYAPPDGGQPPGNVLIPEFGNFHDVRFANWTSDHAWDSLGIEVMGPCRIQLFASVQQTDPSTRPAPYTPFTAAQLAVLPPEEAFIQAFPLSVYTRIAGSLIYETASMLPETLLTCQDKEIAKRGCPQGRELVLSMLGADGVTVTPLEVDRTEPGATASAAPAVEGTVAAGDAGSNATASGGSP